MPREKADLHTHTTFSDGVHSPEEIIKRAYKKSISTLSITDHDSVGAYTEAMPIADKFGIELITGIEFSSVAMNREIHILGYFVDVNNEGLLSTLDLLAERRILRAQAICDELNKLNVQITLEQVTENYTNTVIGRPHIASTMVKLGLVKSFHQAFFQYLSDNAPAYKPKVLLEAKETVDLIHSAGGLAFLAHPGNLNDEIIIDAINAGLDGLEIVHPSQNANRKRKLIRIVNEYLLLKSGGSDFHGGDRHDEQNFGKHFINPPYITAMKNYLLKKTA